MFERKRAVLNAAGVAYLLSGFLLAVAGGLAYFVSQQDPHRLAMDVERLLWQRGQYIGVSVLAGLLLFGAAVAGLIVGVALAARAARLHPTSAALGGGFWAAAMLALAAQAVWTGLVVTYAAMQYRGLADEMHKHALLVEAHLNPHILMLTFWCFLGFLAVGLYFLARALRGERGWLPDVLKLAAALILLHLPVSLYVARASLLEGRYVRWLAVADQLLLWSGLAVASFFSARWLRAVGRSLPP